jgi:hypothetical protein
VGKDRESGECFKPRVEIWQSQFNTTVTFGGKAVEKHPHFPLLPHRMAGQPDTTAPGCREKEIKDDYQRHRH